MSTITIYQLQVPQKTLRRLVPRTMRIAARHEGQPVIQAAAAVVVPAAETFGQLYDARLHAQQGRRQSIRDGHVHRDALSAGLRAWGSLLGTALDIDSELYTPPTSVPDDVIETAKQLVTYLEGLGEDERPAVAERALEALKQATEPAESEWGEARIAASDAQAVGQAVREAAAEYHHALVAFRRVLATVLGRRHVDYRALRITRNRHVDEDEIDEVVVEDEAGSDVERAEAPSGAEPTNPNTGDDRLIGELPVEEVAAE